MIDITGAYPLSKDEWMEAFDALKKLQLFPDEYVRSELQRFEDLYRKLLSPAVTLGDVLSIIDLQCELLGRIQQARKELNKPGPNDQVDGFIYNELRSQYAFGDINFTDEILFWQSKLGFLLNFETEADRETAMISTYEKALSYIGEAEWSLEFYDDAVQYLWSLLDEPEKVFDKQKKSLKEKPRDYSKLMVNVRKITERAMGVSSFKGNSQVFQWKILNEFRYLQILEAKKHALETSLDDLIKEIDLTECIIRTSYSDFSFAFLKDVMPMLHLFDLLLEFRDIPLAEELFNKMERELASVKPTTFEIQEWFINQCTWEDDKSVRKSLDLMTYALKTIPTKEMLDFCIYKLQTLLHHIFGSSSRHTTSLSEIVQLCMEVYKCKKYEGLKSEMFYSGRIMFLKLIPDCIKRLGATSDWEVIESLQAFLDKYPIQEIAVNSLEKVPSSFALVKEVVLSIISKGKTLTEADVGRILQYLSAVNWKEEMDNEILEFLKIVYQSFVTASSELKQNLVKFFNMRHIPGMDEILSNHVKMLYLEDLDAGRKFFNEVRLGTSSWKLVSTVIEVETDYCSEMGEYSRVLKTAINDSFRLPELASTVEPLKLCLRTHCRMKSKKEVTKLIENAKRSLISQPNISETTYGEFVKYTDELFAEKSSLGLD